MSTKHAKKPKQKKSKSRDKLHKIFGHIMAIIAIILVIAVFGGAYYFVIAPNMVSKPFIEKPDLPDDALEKIRGGEQVITSGHINYLINEIGAYKLRKPFATKSLPIIEFIITDTNEKFYSYVNDNKPTTKKGNPKNEDIIIKGSQETILKILESGNTLAAVKQANDNNEIQVELVSDMKTLAAKGYLSLYDTLK